MNELKYSNSRSSKSNRGTLGSLKNQIKSLKITQSLNNNSSSTLRGSLNKPQLKNSLPRNNSQLSKKNMKSPVRKLIDNNVLQGYCDSIIESINQFSFDFYSQTSANILKNVAFSPISLFHLLNIFHSCSDDGTISELKSVLHLDKTDCEKYFSLLVDLLNNNFVNKNDASDLINVKCTALAKENFLLKKYIQTMETNFGVDLIESSFMLEEKIKTLNVSKLSDIFMILNNNLDLKLSWKREFNSINEKGTFTKPNNEQISIELMNIPKHRFLYSKNPKGYPIKLCEFPFLNEDYAFTILLPEKNSLKDIELKLNNRLFNELVKEMKFVEVNSVLPKFKIKDEFDLCNVLKALGANSLIDFSSKKHGLCVDKAFYTSTIDVNYKSVLASSETNVILTRESNPTVKANLDHPCEEFNCENPFLFYIRNKSSNLILFMGKLMVPDSE